MHELYSLIAKIAALSAQVNAETNALRAARLNCNA